MAIFNTRPAAKRTPRPPAAADPLPPRRDPAQRCRSTGHQPPPVRAGRQRREGIADRLPTPPSKARSKAAHVRIAGRFKGDVSVRATSPIEPGAKLAGGVREHKVTVSERTGGNIDSASQVG